MREEGKAKSAVPGSSTINICELSPTMTSNFLKLALALNILPSVYGQMLPPGFQTLLTIFMPTPVEFPQEEYDGWEFRYGRFVFRPASTYINHRSSP